MYRSVKCGAAELSRDQDILLTGINNSSSNLSLHLSSNVCTLVS